MIDGRIDDPYPNHPTQPHPDQSTVDQLYSDVEATVRAQEFEIQYGRTGRLTERTILIVDPTTGVISNYIPLGIHDFNQP